MKVLLGIFLATVLILLGGAFFLNRKNSPTTNSSKVDEKLLIREDSVKISSPSAQTTLVEFSDFQCPACGAYHPVIKQLLEEFKGKINFVYRHFPLDQHQNALPAAYASEAANEQSKFWEMYDLLFEKQDSWSEQGNPEEIFSQYAKSLGLDEERFKQDFASQQTRQKVANDRLDGQTLGVNSTPTFFLNGVKLTNPSSFDDFKAIIAGEIAKNPIKQEESQSVHFHFDLKISLFGKALDLSLPKYQSDQEGNELDEKIHLHDGNGKVVHIHARGSTLGYFLKTIGFTFDGVCLETDSKEKYCKKDLNTLKIFINGKEIENAMNYEPKDLDQILIYYGEDNQELIDQEISLVSNDSCIYSEKCPEKGTPPEEKCVGGLGTDCED
ncbi:MAG: protein-disulfide isomerase [uncultured bacterium]|nr:MAG: protein-disulfide isomerase [uncultured bacterium]